MTFSLAATYALSSLPVLAQAAVEGAEDRPHEPPSMLPQLVMFGIIGAIFYFLILRPQQAQEKARRAMLEAVKRRDRVVTTGGIFGTVAEVEKDEIVLKISDGPDVKVRMRRSAVAEVLAEPGTPQEGK
jgi:preprotein translocase subunit YajC